MSEPQKPPDEPLIASASQTVGPFFHVGPGASDRCGVVAGPGVPGERIRLRIRVLDGDGAPVDDAMVELRQADAQGAYAPAAGASGGSAARVRRLRPVAHVEGRRLLLRDDPPGRTRGRRPAPRTSPCACSCAACCATSTRASTSPAIRRWIAIRSCRWCRPNAGRRCSRDARPTAPTWDFVVRLQGPDETVFFDL